MLLERPVQVRLGEIRPPLRRQVRAARYAPLIAAFVALVLHLAGNPHYGFFRDELYFIICGRHPALGYVDQPPLTPLLAAFSQSFGISLFALRAIPAVFAAIATYAACFLAVEFGGGVFAVIIAGLVTIVAPEMMAFGARLSPDTIETAIWPFVALIAYRIVKGASPKWWLLAAFLIALAGWSKYSVAFFGFALVAGIALTPYRRVLKNWWFTGGVAIAVALLMPNAMWQWHYHFPMLQLLHNDYGKFLLTWPPFPIQQIMIMSPLLSIVWLVGLGWLLSQARTRFLGYTYLIVIAMMWPLAAKAYYPAAIYPYLIAAGAVPIERWTGLRHAWRVAIISVVALCAIPSTPFVLPVLPMRTYVQYQQFAARMFNIQFHVGDAPNSIPIQFYAEMTGWTQMTQIVASIYDGLPPSERVKTAVYAHNFGEASAIELYGRNYRLPPVLSGNNNYWIWGPRGYSGQVVIDVNGPELLKYYRSVRQVGTFRNPLAMPYESNLPIWVLRDPVEPLAQIWPQLRNYSYAFGGM